MNGMGVTFGKYTLLRKIAEGGMAEIFLANQSGLRGFSKLVVIKRILGEYSKDPLWSSMFLDEARIAATLTHPNVVQVFDAGSVDGTLFIAMEYLAGEDVRHLIRALAEREEALALEHALTIISELAKGLDYAHDKTYGGKRLEIVHRDIAPKNVVISLDGAVKVLDFGIAKAANKLSETRVGLLKGSLAYMSPEQAKSSDLIDRRSDIFSVGIMLFELTTARRLFKAKTDYDTLQKVVSDPIPRPSDVAPGYPARLEAIVMRCLERDPAARYQTCRELYVELDAFARATGLETGAHGLRQLMERLFSDRISAMREAERMGEDLATFVPADDQESISGVLDASALASLSKGGSTMSSLSQLARLSALQDKSTVSTVSGVGASRSDASIPPVAGRTRIEEAPSPHPWRTRVIMAASLVGLIFAGAVLAGVGPASLTGRRTSSAPAAASSALSATQPAPAAGSDRAAAVARSSAPQPAAAAGAEQPAAGAMPAATPTPSKRVNIELVTTPPGAALFLDDRPVGTTPARFDVEAGASRRVLRMVLAGHQELTEELIADRDVRLQKVLVPLKARNDPRRRIVRRAPEEKTPAKKRVVRDLVDPFQ